MQRDVDEVKRSEDRTGLDHPINLASIPLHWLGWGGIVLAYLGISLTGRTNWPLAPGESAIARDAWALVQGNDLSSSADSHPILVQLVAFTFFLFGDTDFVARLIPLLAGLAIIGTLMWLRGWFGAIPSLSIAAVWTVSPVMTFSALRLDGAMVLVLAMFLVFSLSLTNSADPTPRKGIVLGLALAVGLASHPLGWIVLPLTLIPSMAMMRDFRLGGQWPTVLATAAVSFVLTATWFMTRPGGLLRFFEQSWSSLWDDHLATMGSSWQLPILALLIDESVIPILVIVGLIVISGLTEWDISCPPAVFLACFTFAVPMITVGILLGGSGPALFAISLFPLIVVAGLGLSMVIEATREAGSGRGRIVLWAVVAPGLLLAIVRFAVILAQGPEDNTVGWLLSAGALGLLILTPLAAVAIRIASGVGWRLVPISLLVIALLLGGLQTRTSLLLTGTDTDRNGEMLIAGSSTPAVTRLEHRIRTYSRDVTTFTRDVRDPAGGHALVIVLEKGLDDPFAWYFRDFPNLLVVERPEDIPDDTVPDVVFLHDGNESDWESAMDQHRVRSYSMQYAEHSDIPDRTMNGLLLAAINPLEFGNLVNYVVFRRTPELLVREGVTIALRNEHAQVIWGPQPEDNGNDEDDAQSSAPASTQ